MLLVLSPPFRFLTIPIGVFIWSAVTPLGKKPIETAKAFGLPNTPVPIENLDYKGISKVVCGSNHSVALSGTGAIYVFGSGKYGALGTGREADISYKSPYELSFFAKSGTRIKDIAIGEHHTIFLSDMGEVYTCGYGGKQGLLTRFIGQDTGALGHGNKTHSAFPKKVAFFEKSQIRVKQIAAGRYHSIALAENGDIYTWGRGAYGVLGDGKKTPSLTPVLVEDVAAYRKEDAKNEVIKIDAAENFTIALTKNGEVLTWGENDQGQMGVGVGTGLDMIESENVPTIVNFGENVKIKDVVCGEGTMMAIDDKHTVYRAGLKLHYTPVKMKIPDVHKLGKLTRIFCGRKHYTMLDGNLFC